ncbi:MAG: IPT/TIG domain-containing protein [Acidobacteriaceae bacterium]
MAWANGTIFYFTDQDDLSPILRGSNADAFVATAFAEWTTIPTAAVKAVHAGRLEEDVGKTNFCRRRNDSKGVDSLSLPTDLLPSAPTIPVGVIYDLNGSVTEAMLGPGEGNVSRCSANAAFGGIDNFGVKGKFSHALIVLNGVCAQRVSQLPDMKYQLVRLIGRIFGLDWSQLNVNVLTQHPPPTAEDFEGFPLMHAADPPNCVHISSCLPNASKPKVDDQAAMSRLYPVTIQNQADFSGKRLLFENTISIHGTVRFATAGDHAGLPVQGVNVVARWIDPASGQPSRRFAASSVSGFLFRRHSGDSVDDGNDNSAYKLNRWGPNDPRLQGFFDIAGLPIPDGSSTAQYQLSVESLDPRWSQSVGQSLGRTVAQGEAAPIIVSASAGSDIDQDIVMVANMPAKQNNLAVVRATEPGRFRTVSPDRRADFPSKYRAQASAFFADSVVPSRVSAAGGNTIAIHGSGLLASTAVAVGQLPAAVVGISAGRLLVTTPAMRDGVQDISLFNAAGGSSFTFPGAITYGASASDTIHLISGASPSTPIGGQAITPVTVQVLAADGLTPVAGASVLFTSSPAASLSLCGGAASCTVLSDLSGEAATRVTVLVAGATTITAKLAPASYLNPQTVQATVVGFSSASLDISLDTTLNWIATGATVDVPLVARVLVNGVPLNSRTVDYFLTKGTASFSAASATTDLNGYASSLLHIPAASGDVQASVCVAPADAPCQTFNGTTVATVSLQLQSVAGLTQVAAAGQSFRPVILRVTDSFVPPHPVMGANVIFDLAVGRLPGNAPVPWLPANPQNPGTQTSLPAILATSQLTSQSDVDGNVSIQPASGIPGPTLTLGTASIGNSVLSFQLQSIP